MLSFVVNYSFNMCPGGLDHKKISETFMITTFDHCSDFTEVNCNAVGRTDQTVVFPFAFFVYSVKINQLNCRFFSLFLQKE